MGWQYAYLDGALIISNPRYKDPTDKAPLIKIGRYERPPVEASSQHNNRVRMRYPVRNDPKTSQSPKQRLPLNPYTSANARTTPAA